MDDEQRILYGDPNGKRPEGVMCGHCGSDLGPIELKHAEVLRLEDGDVIILQFEKRLSDGERTMIRGTWNKLFPKNRVIVFDGSNMSISVPQQEALV